MGHWFRMYDETLDDEKANFLSDKMFRNWVNILCIASMNDGVLPPIKNLCFRLRMNEQAVSKILNELCECGLLDPIEVANAPMSYEPHNWSERQFVSDHSTPRVKRHRDRKRNDSETLPETFQGRSKEQPQAVPETADETLPETHQNRTEQNRTEQIVLDAPLAAPKRGGRLPEDWNPRGDDWAQALDKLGQQGSRDELEKFRDYWKAQPGQRGVKLDWDATWRNWIRNARGSNGQQSVQKTGGSVIDAAKRQLAEIEKHRDDPALSVAPVRSLQDGSVRGP